MRLYLLEQDYKHDYDCTEAIVVRAESKAEARKLASECAGDEGADAWLSKKHTTCKMLRHSGIRGTIISDFRAG